MLLDNVTLTIPVFVKQGLNVLVENVTLTIRVLRIIRHVLHSLEVKWIMSMKSYLHVLVDKIFIRERKTIVRISYSEFLFSSSNELDSKP